MLHTAYVLSSSGCAAQCSLLPCNVYARMQSHVASCKLSIWARSRPGKTMCFCVSDMVDLRN
eukprot:8104685-Pyramimonas_sp.AAC.1